MNAFFTELPIWLQELVAWITTGSTLATLVTLFGIIMHSRGSDKENKAAANTQVDLLNRIVDKLSTAEKLVEKVQVVSADITSAIAYFENAISSQKQANINLASFVMECFNKSNLSDEVKTELQLLGDKLFYEDTDALIDALKRAKTEADTALVASQKEILQLRSELEIEKQKLAIAQENTKASRRV